MVTEKSKTKDFRLGRRHADRHFRRGFGSSVIKNLTELITNADTEYCFAEAEASRRPESFYGANLDSIITEQFSTRMDAKPIIIVADEINRRFQVIDHGRGFPKSKMDKTIWAEIGEDMAQVLGETGEPKRSLFGEGLSAVLWVQMKGNIRSIVDDYLHDLRVLKVAEEQKLTEPRISRRKVQASQRRALRMPEGNGTIVEFELDPSVAKQWPSEATLLSWLNNHWALRMINLDPTRQVLLVYKDRKGEERTHKCTFQFPSGSRKLDELNKTFRFDGDDLRITGTLWRSPAPLSMRPGDRRNGILVIDENDACYALEFFGFDKSEYTANLFGILRLGGAAQAVRKATNAGQEIISDDREGFSRKHTFYQRLVNEIVDPWLKPIVEEERKERLDAGRPSASVNRALGRALRMINQVFDELTELESEPQYPTTGEEFYPKDGLEFVGSKRRNLRVGATSVLRLVADPKLFTIVPSASIEFLSAGGLCEVSPSEVSLTRDEDELTSNYIKVTATEVGSGRVSAVAIRDNESTAQTDIEFTFENEEIPNVPNGIAFIPEISRISPNRRHALRLYVDTNAIPIGSVIELDIDSLEQNVHRLSLEVESLEVSDSHPFIAHVAKLPVYVIGFSEGPPLSVRARTSGGLSAITTVEIGNQNEPPPGKGRFGLPEYRSLQGTSRRTQWDNDPAGSGAIVINATDSVNRLYYGERVEEFKQALDDLPHSRLLLAELMMEEVVLSTYTIMADNGKIGEYPTKSEATRNALAEIRGRYSTVIHNALFSKASLRKLGIIS